MTGMKMGGGFLQNNLPMIVATAVAIIGIGIWWWVRHKND